MGDRTLHESSRVETKEGRPDQTCIATEDERRKRGKQYERTRQRGRRNVGLLSETSRKKKKKGRKDTKDLGASAGEKGKRKKNRSTVRASFSLETISFGILV